MYLFSDDYLWGGELSRVGMQESVVGDVLPSNGLTNLTH